MRLIDADALIENKFKNDISYNAFVSLVKRQPSAQPQHMKGKWIHDGYDFPHGNDWIHCSICGKKGINVPADLTNFCPNCGADMRRRNDN